MKDFFKYFDVTKFDEQWGVYLTVAGRLRVNENTEIYPIGDHPSQYLFKWGNGRILDEYQLNFVTEGNGVFIDDTGEYEVKPGSFMLIRPGIRHRYKPLYKTGWIENYIGFKGKLANQFMQNLDFEQPVINVGIKEEFIDTYLKIYELVNREGAAFQQIASGMLIKLLGYILAFQRKTLKTSEIDKFIEEARFYMRNHLDITIDMNQLAETNHISYASFRKSFKNKVGVSPHQYHLNLKMQFAKEMLLSSDKSIKEISRELGFDSEFYFSRFFKKKIGVTASNFRLNGKE